MNEYFFIVHIVLVALVVLGALRLGKEALIALFCFQALIANLFVLKQMNCLSLVVTCTDTYIIGCDFSLGLLQKYYGEKVAKKTVLLCLCLLFFFVIVSQLHLLYQPSEHDTYQPIYKQLLQTTPRIILSSLLVGFISQKLNIFLQKLLQKKYPLCPPMVALFVPILFSQLFDTIAFSCLALYGVVHSLTNIIVMSYLIKVFTIFCMAPFANFSKKFHRVAKS